MNTDEMMLLKSESAEIVMTSNDLKIYSEICNYSIYWDDDYGRFILTTKGKFAEMHPLFNDFSKEVARKNEKMFKSFGEGLQQMGNSTIILKDVKKLPPVKLVIKEISENIEEIKKEFRSEDNMLKSYLDHQLKTKYKNVEVFARFDNIAVTDEFILISTFKDIQ